MLFEKENTIVTAASLTRKIQYPRNCIRITFLTNLKKIQLSEAVSPTLLRKNGLRGATSLKESIILKHIFLINSNEEMNIHSNG